MADFFYSSMTELPKELSERAHWEFSYSEQSPERFWFAKKTEMLRSEAWAEIAPSTFTKFEGNPWRKMHTENYWCWYWQPGIDLDTGIDLRQVR